MRADSLIELTEMSARVGAERLLVQGPGGNTSLKDGDALWVKGSGRWLAEAHQAAIFVPLSLAGVRQQIADGQAEDFGGAIMTERAAAGLRPSIETALHALMPHRIGIHAHAVNSVTTSTLRDGPERVARALADLRWAWIPYRRPGLPLAEAVSAALATGPCDVLMLESHGVVVGADTPQAAEALLHEVERRLHLPPRALPSAEDDRLAALETDAYEAERSVSGLALDPELTRILATAPLFPDQVVFVGGAVPVIAPGETVADAAQGVAARSGITPVLMLAPGIGAVARRDRSAGARSLIEGLFEVAIRIPPGSDVRGLTPHDAAALLNWDAEQYRQALDARRSQTG